MKARVIRDSIYVPDLEVDEIVEIVPGMETDSEGIFNIPGGKLFLCKKSNGTFTYEFPANLQIIIEDQSAKNKSLKEFESIIKPVNDYLRQNYHPHTVIIVDYDGAHIYEALMGIPKMKEETIWKQ